MAKMFPPMGGGGMDKMLGDGMDSGSDSLGMPADEGKMAPKKSSKSFGKPMAKKSMRGAGKKIARY